MNRRTSINIALEQSELDALVTVAKRDLRHPRDQARFILRAALMADRAGPEPPGSTKANDAELVRARGAVAG